MLDAEHGSLLQQQGRRRLLALRCRQILRLESPHEARQPRVRLLLRQQRVRLRLRQRRRGVRDAVLADARRAGNGEINTVPLRSLLRLRRLRRHDRNAIELATLQQRAVGRLARALHLLPLQHLRLLLPLLLQLRLLPLLRHEQLLLRRRALHLVWLRGRRGGHVRRQ